MAPLWNALSAETAQTLVIPETCSRSHEREQGPDQN